MRIKKNKLKYYVVSFLKHDFKASINVFLEALPLCIGISLASGLPIYSGFVAGIIGGTIVAKLSGSELCIRGPATGLITVCITAIAMLGNIEYFFAAVAIAGLMQILLGSFSMGSVTYFIPSVVVKGMMAAIGIILIIKQIPFALGNAEIEQNANHAFFSIISVKQIVVNSFNVWNNISPGVIIITTVSFAILYLWDKRLSKKLDFFPTYLIIVVVGILISYVFKHYIPELALSQSQYFSIPHNIFDQVKIIHIPNIFKNPNVWRAALLICLVSTIESLVTVEAIDKADPHNRITPRSRELVAQGAGNLLSGIFGGLPITALIAQSVTNLESGARTHISSYFQGAWLLLGALIIPYFFHMIPHCAMAVIIIRIGAKLANPAIFINLYKAGRKQFQPFIITIVAILLTDLLIGVLIGIVYCFYCLIKNGFKADFYLNEKNEGHIKHYTIRLAQNVTFLNKKNIIKLLDHIPNYSVVEIIGSDGGSVDYDVLEIINHYKAKAHNRHIELILKNMPNHNFINHLQV